MFFKKKQSYEIIVVGQYGNHSYECATEKEKNQWLYEYLSNNEKVWAWEQWQNSPYKTFNKWVKEYTKEQFKWADLQTLRINKALILIRKIKKI